jgi:peptide deformylase
LHARFGGRDLDGEEVTIEASGLEARVLQHELDHLDGILILDRAPRDQRKAALRALREGASFSPFADDEERPVDEGEHHTEPRTDA